MGLIFSRKEKHKIGSRCNLSKKENNRCDFRTYILFFLIVFLAGIIIFRLYNLQIVSGERYKALAKKQHFSLKNLVPKRGEIFLKDKEGVYPIAINKSIKMAYAVPKEIKDPNETAKVLSQFLDINREELEKRISNPNEMYKVLKNRLSEEEIEKILELKLSGVYLSDEKLRYYPADELASQILGFVGWKEDEFGGRYGIENYFEEELSGQAGSLFQSKDNLGRWIPTREKELDPVKDGYDLVLTVDNIIQYETEKLLKSAVQKFRAERGVVVVMEPQTGRILSMANYPNFNPNEYRLSKIETFRNLSISDSYECGSVFKPITLAAAIDSGKINSQTTFTDTGKVVEAGYTIRNSDLKSYGIQTMSQVLEKSLNTGVIHAQKLIGNESFYDYVKRFGFGSVTGINLPGESPGNISNLKNTKIRINFFTASFGQGITVTPIQLVSAFSAIANGGTLMKPQIVEKIIKEDGSVENIEPEEIRKVISQKAANEISQILRNVVVEGHGKRADVPGYLVGGKTGTAQVAKVGTKGYEEGRNIGSFVGFAPINDPQFAIIVRMDNPKEVIWAESSAAPVFGELMKFLLEYRNIQPTEEYTQADLDKFKNEHTLSDYFIEKQNEKEDEIKNEESER